MFVPNLNKIIAPNSDNDKWYLFLKGGLGATFLKEYSGLYPYNKPGIGFVYALAYGGGLSYTVNEKIKLKIGTTWYRVETDRLDGVHTAKPNGDIRSDAGYYFNVKEKYFYPYIGLTYGFGQIISKAHFMQRRNSTSLWFKPSTHKYKRRR
jgi:opacity protein-like surface antigen